MAYNSNTQEPQTLKVGIIMTFDEEQSDQDYTVRKYLLIKQHDNRYSEQDNKKVKWSFPKTSQLPEEPLAMQTAQRVAEQKLFVSIPSNLFQAYWTFGRAAEGGDIQILECFWYMKAEQLDQFTYLEEDSGPHLTTHYKWASKKEMYQLMKEGDLSHGTKNWLLAHHSFRQSLPSLRQKTRSRSNSTHSEYITTSRASSTSSSPIPPFQ